MFNRLRRDAIRIIMVNLLAFGFSWVMVTYVFLGPLPRISPQFRHRVKDAPQTIAVESKKAVTLAYAKVSSYMKNAPTQTEEQIPSGPIILPPPWVFGDTVVSTPTPYMEPPAQQPLPTALPVPTALPRRPGIPSQPTSVPQPTAIPRPTARPTQKPAPTNVPPPTMAPLNGTEMEDGVLAEINRRRKEIGLGTLRMQGNLQQAARGHSEYMKSQGKISHTGANGSTPMDRVEAAKYTGQPAGEVVIYGYPTPVQSVEGWWQSPGHHAILTKPNITEIGIGFSGTFGTAVVGL